MNLLDLMVKIGVKDEASSAVAKTSDGIKSNLQTAAVVGTAALAAMVTGTVALVSAFSNAANAVADYGDNVDKMSQKMGMSASAYQEWDSVMRHSGTSMETMKAGMRTLANAVESGNEAFQRIGLTQEQISSMSQEDLFAATINGLQNVESETERTYLAGKLLGRGATELGALLNTSAEDTQKMRDRVHELGGVMSDESVKASAAYKDSMQDLQTAMDGARNRAMAEFLPAFTTVMNGLQELLIGNTDLAAESIGKGIADAVAVMKENGPKIVDSAMSVLKNLVVIVRDNGPAILDAALSFFGEVLRGLAETAPEIAGDLVLLLGDLIGYVVEHIPDMLAAVVNFLSTFLQGIAKKAPEVLMNLAKMVANGLKKVLDFGKSFFDAGAKIVGEVAQAIAKGVGRVVSNMGKGISDTVEKVKSFVSAFLTAGAQLVASVINGIAEKIGGIADTVRNGISDAVSTVQGFVGEMFSAGWNVVQGIIDGIVSNIGNVAGTILGGFKGAVDTVKNFLGIASPSKLFAEIGKNTMLGMAEGIEDNMSKAQKAMQEAAGEIYGAASGEVAIGASGGVLGASGNAYGVPAMNFYGDITVVADDPEDFMRQLTTFAARTRAQYA